MEPASGPSAAPRIRTGTRCSRPRASVWCAARVGASSSSPASASPPPTMTTSGSSRFSRLAMPSATHQANWRSTSNAPGSPSAAASVTCSPRTASGSPPARLTSPGAVPASAASRPRRPSPLPEAKRSQQPRCPHGHGGPLGSTTMWPGSPAKPDAPRTRRSPMITAPPMPVPSVTSTRSDRPTPAPRRCSATAAQLASLSTATAASPVASATATPTSRPTMPGRLGATCNTPRRSTSPAMPTPTPRRRGWPRASSWRSRSATAAASASTTAGAP